MRGMPTPPDAAAAGQPLARLEGTLERVTFHNPENGYTIARLQPAGRSHTVTVVGPLPTANVGASLILLGRWTSHPQYGKQLLIERAEEKLPATIEGIRRYLGSGMIRGVGPVTAERIVDHFGAETLVVIDEAPERLAEVPGVGPKRAGTIAQAWVEQRQIKQIMLFLQSHGVSTGLAVRIYKAYGDQAADVVRQDPYRLAREVFGIGFRTADQIAQGLGLAADAPRRLEAGLGFALGGLADEGHCFAPRAGLLREAARLLEVAPELLDPAVDRLLATGELIDGSLDVPPEAAAAWIYLPPFFHAETGLARRLRRHLDEPASRLGGFRTLDWEAAFVWLDRRLPHPLAPRQREAVRLALTRKLCVITGGPGTGKTTTVRAILELLAAKGGSVRLAAPTGRAAKRLAEASGLEARTLHRLLEFAPAEGRLFKRGEDNPLPADLLVVDEVSMVDLLLMNHLAKAVDPASHLVLVGDVDQLPAVGAGNVLRDLIASGAVPTVALDQIFRQSAHSHIIVNAHRINQGQMPLLEKDSEDFFLFPAEEAEAAADWVVDLVSSRIPARFGLDPREDIQVLSPMHRGAAGVGALNERLQAVLNPPVPGHGELRWAGRVLRVGDKLMQLRNNYEKDVFNGDVGRLTAIDPEEQTALVNVDGREVVYAFAELDELTLAYAISTHKSQGSEYPAVVMTLLPQHHLLLQRNLLYTGVTRARRLCILVGSRRALARALKNDAVAARHTGLARRLGGGRLISDLGGQPLRAP